jgi:hypothetical protein
MRVGGLGVALEGALEQLLRRDEVAAVELDDAAVVERVGVARQRRLGAQARLGDVEVGARARRHLGDARVLLDEGAEVLARGREVPAREIFVGALEGFERRGLVARGLARRGRRVALHGLLCGGGLMRRRRGLRRDTFGRLGRRCFDGA